MATKWHIFAPSVTLILGEEKSIAGMSHKSKGNTNSLEIEAS